MPSSRSRSKSRRGRRSPLTSIFVIACTLALLGGGIVWMFSGDDEIPAGAEAAGIAEVAKKAQEAPPANISLGAGANTWAEIDQLVQDAVLRIGTKTGAARQAAIAETYALFVARLEQPLPPEGRKRLLPKFHELTDELLFGLNHNEFNTTHTVVRGESLNRIAKKYGVTEELLCDWNGIPRDKKSKLQLNQTLKVVIGKPRIAVSKRDFVLSYYFGDRLARQFIIAHGKGNNTPEGIASVVSKEIDPDQGPHVGPMQQEMDERWIGLTVISGRSGIGIHGTKYEDSIPGETSHGCIRMFNADVIKLFEWVPYGCSVEIKP